MEQLLAHLVGDFILQTDWMALNKKKPGWLGQISCFIHSILYTLPFLLLTHSTLALSIIWFTHLIIDRTNLIPWLIWIHNYASPPAIDNKQPTWKEASTNGGYHPNRPVWLAIWLCIIVDNTFHLLINYSAIRWF